MKIGSGAGRTHGCSHHLQRPPAAGRLLQRRLWVPATEGEEAYFHSVTLPWGGGTVAVTQTSHKANMGGQKSPGGYVTNWHESLGPGCSRLQVVLSFLMFQPHRVTETAAGTLGGADVIRALLRSATTDGLEARTDGCLQGKSSVCRRTGPLPPQAVRERGGPRCVAFPVHHAALAAWAQGPERR